MSMYYIIQNPSDQVDSKIVQKSYGHPRESAFQSLIASIPY